MPPVNPARELYFNMDIENLDQPQPKQEAGGLLAPRKAPVQEQNTMSDKPAFRVGQHMLRIRKRREMLNA